VSNPNDPIALTDSQYRVRLLDILGVCEWSDPAHNFTIEQLEEHITSAGLLLPTVRRIASLHPTCIDVTSMTDAPATVFICGPDCPRPNGN
jgi:hypothetical protein